MSVKLTQPFFRAALLILLALGFSSQVQADARFPLPAQLAGNGHFWLRVYSEWTTGDYAIHDDRHLDVVYFSVKASNRNDPAINKAIGEVKAALRRLNKKRLKTAKGLKSTDLKVYKAWEKYRKDPGRFARGLGHVRAQRGLRDRFASALEEASRLRGHIEPILDAHDVPRELYALVFVESMFHPHARSYSGAVGLWQFMPYTGREYLNINRLNDERRDPIIASNAAGSYLRSAYLRLKSWPVAITSYNYGMNGMARAVRAVGKSDLGLIVRNYRNGRLGFAAKNYYSEFWAALEIWKNPKKYFPKTRYQPTWTYDLLRVPGGLRLNKLIRTGALSEARLRADNPALSNDAIKGRIALPRGFALRLPKGSKSKVAKSIGKMSGLSAGRQGTKTRAYKVRRGDSLIAIARRHGISTGQLLTTNHMDLHATIYPGQKLRIPGKRNNFTLFPDARSLAILQPAILQPANAKPSTALAQAERQKSLEKSLMTTTNTAASTANKLVASNKKARKTPQKSSTRSRRKSLLANLPPRPRVLRFRQNKKRYLLMAGPAVEQSENQAAPLAAVDIVLGASPLPAVDLVVGRSAQDMHKQDLEEFESEPEIPNS